MVTISLETTLIWSEGAIYNIGFERGLKEWRRFLKEGAYLAVSEASWFTEKRPAEIETFWQDAYPEIVSGVAWLKLKNRI